MLSLASWLMAAPATMAATDTPTPATPLPAMVATAETMLRSLRACTVAFWLAFTTERAPSWALTVLKLTLVSTETPTAAVPEAETVTTTAMRS